MKVNYEINKKKLFTRAYRSNVNSRHKGHNRS